MCNYYRIIVAVSLALGFALKMVTEASNADNKSGFIFEKPWFKYLPTLLQFVQEFGK